MERTENNLDNEKLWQGLAIEWLRILSLPALPWTQPFLPILDLPEALLENLSVWKDIYARAVAEHEARRKNLHDDLWNDLTRQVVIRAFQELAQQIGKEGAVEFERWVRRHFFRQDIIAALSYWRRLLATACLPFYPGGEYREYRIPPPKALERLLPEIFPLVVSAQRDWKIDEEMRKAAPRKPDEELEDERFPLCYEYTLLSSATRRALTIQALQKIAKGLAPEERQEVIDWVARQAPVHRPRLNTQILRTDEYLRVESPGSDMLSILDDRRD